MWNPDRFRGSPPSGKGENERVLVGSLSTFRAAAFTHLHGRSWAAREPQTPPPPWWGRASPLSDPRTLIRGLEAKGEGVTLDERTLSPSVLSAAVTPSPRFSKLASS